MRMSGVRRRKTNKQTAGAVPVIRSRYLGEPKLVFADGREDVDPKLGISRFGPKSWRPERRHPSTLRVGFVGPPDAIDQAHRWLEKSAAGVHGDEDHPEFPGCMSDRGFMTKLTFDPAWCAPLYRGELDELAPIRSLRDRFQGFVSLLETKLRLLSERDQAPEYVVAAIPNDLYRKYRIVEFRDRAAGLVHRDLRRAFKAMAMKYRIPTQILRDATATESTGDNLSKVAWNFFTGLYFKAGGTPWGPVGLQPGSCYVGISFYRRLGSASSTVQTSLVQAFDEHGDGLVLRGHEFEWDAEKEGTNAPHLSETHAEKLVDMVLTRTVFSVDDLDFLYTTGFISELNQFHSTHVPAPIRLADHIGNDTPREMLLREIMILTKMNWNSARLGGLMPITLRFSQLVGDIMREIGDWEPLTNFKYYT